MNHAQTPDGLPLIGIPPEATDERCDFCLASLFLDQIAIVMVNGETCFLCRKCRLGLLVNESLERSAKGQPPWLVDEATYERIKEEYREREEQLPFVG